MVAAELAVDFQNFEDPLLNADENEDSNTKMEGEMNSV
jgi:hypothetical protein